MALDVRKAKDFYGQLFDWKLEDMPMPEMACSMSKVGEGAGGGLMSAECAVHRGVLCRGRRSCRGYRKGEGAGGDRGEENVAVAGQGGFQHRHRSTGAFFGLWFQKKT